MGFPCGTIQDFEIRRRAHEIILITGLVSLMEIELSRFFFVLMYTVLQVIVILLIK